MIEVIVKYNGDLSKIGDSLGAEIEILNQNYAIITLRQDQIELLYNFIEIEYIELPKTLTYNLNQELIASCMVNESNSEYTVTGKGVLIAIIDSGVDYTHPDFRNEDGTTRIEYIWDQTVEGNPPKGFKSGTAYTKQEINTALESGTPYNTVSQRDNIGHGSKVAGIACRKWKVK